MGARNIDFLLADSGRSCARGRLPGDQKEGSSWEAPERAVSECSGPFDTSWVSQSAPAGGRHTSTVV